MKKIILCFVVFVMCLIAVLTLGNKKVSATSEFLTDGIAYNGVVVRANYVDDTYTVFIDELDTIWGYTLSDFYFSESLFMPSKGAIVVCDTNAQKWQVLNTYEATEYYADLEGYNRGVNDTLNG